LFFNAVLKNDMVLDKKTNTRWLKFLAAAVLLFAAVFPAYAQAPAASLWRSNTAGAQSEEEKAVVLREQALSWIQVGITQLNRRLYEQAEKSFQAAREYQEYLTAGEKKKLQENLDKASRAVVERKVVLENLVQARDLLNSGRPIEARSHYEKVRNSPYLTGQERKEIARELKSVDTAFDKRRKEITGLYNRSVQLYRAGDLERARDGFAEVVKSGILVAPRGQLAEDYLVQIDNILTGRLKPPAEPKLTPKTPRTTPLQTAESAHVQTDSNQQGILPEQVTQKQMQKLQQELMEVKAAAETTPEKQLETAMPREEPRAKIIRTYTKAVVNDAETKVEQFIGRGEFDKALTAVRSATLVVGENRPVIGEDAFVEYSTRLKKLAERIIQARKSS
jgi:TolA-binding protein